VKFRIPPAVCLAADFLKLYRGNAPAANRPQLIVQYYIP
jgi:hypothetical protein